MTTAHPAPPAEMTEPSATGERVSLARALGLRHATAIVVGTVIGTGIFLVPHDMMQAVGSPRLVYLAWIVGGILSLCGALTYAELGAMKPEAGGEYVYLRDAYGPLPAFLDAWMWFTIGKPASIATIAIGIVQALGILPSFGVLSVVLLPKPIAITAGHLLAIAIVLAISAVNYVGVLKAGEFQFIFTLLKLLLLFAVIFMVFNYGHGAAANFNSAFLGARGGMSGFVLALVAALWAYDGWNDLNMVGAEIRNPARNIPIALIAGVSLVALLYMGTNIAVQFLLPAGAIAASLQPVSQAVRLAMGAGVTGIVTLGMALSMLVGLNGTIMSGARVPYAVSRDGYFFRILAEVHPRFRTPSMAILFQALLAILLLLVGGRFKQLFTLTIFAEWLFYMLTASTPFVYHRRHSDATRPFRVPGYPVVPALFVISAAVLLAYTIRENVAHSLMGLAVIAAGIPVFYLFSQRRKEELSLAGQADA